MSFSPEHPQAAAHPSEVRPIQHKAVDALGRDLRLGDWVRVTQAPLSVVGLGEEALSAFSAAIGQTLQVLDFDQVGCLELDLSQKYRERSDTIFLEPFCCVRSRRPRNPGRFFRRYRSIVEQFNARAAT
jgi:hypothetical protein